MGRRTKKAGPAGSLGPRYGVKIRRRIREVLREKGHWHACPRCRHPSVRRVSKGVWHCRRCDLTFAGGAYRPVVTTSIRRQVTRGPGEEATPLEEPEE